MRSFFKVFLFCIASITFWCPCKVQSYISKFIRSTTSRLLSLFEDPNKLTGAQALFLKRFNILIAAFASLRAPTKIYLNKEIQDIIWAVMKTRLAAAKIPYECFLKARFFNIYRSDNHMACYNFCRQCKDYFTTTGAKKSNCISFAVFFFQDCNSFCWQQ